VRSNRRADKNREGETSIIVIPLLPDILAKYKKQFPPVGDGWIFRADCSATAEAVTLFYASTLSVTT
jgi:hypothetical protein